MERENLPLSEQEKLIAQLVRDALGENANRPFRPVAFYKPELDRIEVHVRDCSYAEHWFNGVFYLLQDNYDDEAVIGFAVDLIRVFTDHAAKTVDLDVLLDQVLVRCPQLSAEIQQGRDLLSQLESKLVALER